MNVRSIISRLSLSTAIALAVAAPAGAQEATLASPRLVTPPTRVATVDSTAATPVGPTRDAAALAVRPAADVSTSPMPAPARSGFSHGETLMIVGAAAILTGIVVGNNAGHAISVAGAVVGLIGLYQYLQ